jgi:hypothetical protein
MESKHSKIETIDEHEASAVEQAGFEISIWTNLLTRKSVNKQWLHSLHVLIVKPLLAELKHSPKLVFQEFLPKLKRFHEQLGRSIERIEGQLEKGRVK